MPGQKENVCVALLDAARVPCITNEPATDGTPVPPLPHQYGVMSRFRFLPCKLAFSVVVICISLTCELFLCLRAIYIYSMCELPVHVFCLFLTVHYLSGKGSALSVVSCQYFLPVCCLLILFMLFFIMQKCLIFYICVVNCINLLLPLVFCALRAFLYTQAP